MGPRGYPQGRADFSSVSFLTLGAIAQLGERVNGIHEVGGSIPPGSTSFLDSVANSSRDALSSPQA
jgi:hypothetical protein